MPRLRITPHGEAIVTNWEIRAKPDDRKVVAKLLAAIKDPSTENGFRRLDHLTDPTITVFVPREGLFVLVRLPDDDPADDQFDVVTISENNDVGPIPPDMERG